MRVSIAPRALAQIEELNDWWRLHRQDAADVFDRELERTLAMICRTSKVRPTLRRGRALPQLSDQAHAVPGLLCY